MSDVANSREPVWASMATIPSRVDSLVQAATSLLGQVDGLLIYCNGHSREQVPELLREHDKVVITGTPEGLADLGAEGKFYGAVVPDTYHLICDDDLRYPPNYAETMIGAIERHGRAAVVAAHGSVLTSPLAKTFRASRRHVYHFGDAVAEDRPVHLVGTGCCAFHASTIEVSVGWFGHRNMVDPYFALLCQQENVPRVVIAKPKGWIRQLPFKENIWDKNATSTKPVEVLRRGAPWKLMRTS
jgi:hypothetical protein